MISAFTKRFLQTFREVALVSYVEKFAAVACCSPFFDAVLFSATRIDALLPTFGFHENSISRIFQFIPNFFAFNYSFREYNQQEAQ
jgi:hypothetical protein